MLCSCLIVIRFHDFIFHLLSVSPSIALRICDFFPALIFIYSSSRVFFFFKIFRTLSASSLFAFAITIAIEAVIPFVFFTCTRYQTFDWLFLFLFFATVFLELTTFLQLHSMLFLMRCTKCSSRYAFGFFCLTFHTIQTHTFIYNT